MNILIKKQRLHLAQSWTIARNSSNYKDNVFVVIEKNGISGTGEAAPNIRYNESAESTISDLKNAIPLLEKADILDHVTIHKQLNGIIKKTGCARAAIDIALFDWIGKYKKKPLYKYFNLNQQEIPITSYSIGIDSIANMQKKVEENSHMPIFKIKLGTDKDREIISAIREVTNHPIRVDANEAWKEKEKALRDIEWLAGKNIEFVEQPMPAGMLSETSWLKKRSPIPIIADESVISNQDIPALKKAYDGINIKLMKAGGISEALRMIKTARSLDMKIMLGCMIESSVAIAAAAHIASLVDYVDLDGSLLLARDPYKGLKIENGKIILNDLAGLGIVQN